LAKIILVRHGETDWNKIHRLQGGGSDTPLNELGIQQAENVALRLKNEKLEAIFSSPLQRAVNTARAIASYHQMGIQALSALKEINVGKLEGTDSTVMKIRWDQLLCQPDCDELKLDGIEPIGDVQKRTWSAVQDIYRQHPEGNVVVVSHYVAIMSIVCAVLGLPLSQIVRLKLNPCTITVFSMSEDGSSRLELFNDGCHHQS
jgi:broad specificity phosphatase PhoE